ncbi:hypothetical protein KVT40_002544 [Elsinoe batatas]|uniref:Uncharacterized protein n=1 Tax=Elsinoe batatas TaxID=2601811 RepID=A0A8K0PKC0_9PEZI|nr:hypothetical protein KVT40_002544 [Elsinoe batatas]
MYGQYAYIGYTLACLDLTTKIVLEKSSEWHEFVRIVNAAKAERILRGYDTQVVGRFIVLIEWPSMAPHEQEIQIALALEVLSTFTSSSPVPVHIV